MTARSNVKSLTLKSILVLWFIGLFFIQLYGLDRILIPIQQIITTRASKTQTIKPTGIPIQSVATGNNFVKNITEDKYKLKSSIFVSSPIETELQLETDQTNQSDTTKRTKDKKNTKSSSTSEQLNCRRPIPDSFPLKPLPLSTPKFLKDYAEWHAKQRKCLLDPSCKEKPKILVSRCPPDGFCLGLGDRIRGVFFSFWIAVITERVFFIDWPKKPYALHVGMVPSSIDWTLPPNLPFDESWPFLKWKAVCSGSDECGKKFPTNADIFSHDGKRIDLLTDNLEEKFGSTQLLSIFCRFRPQYLTWISKNPHYAEKFGNYTESLKIVQDYRAFIIPALFQPSKETLKKMKATAFKDDESYMALHIRAGKGVKEDKLDRFSSFSNKSGVMTRNLVNCVSWLREATNGTKRVFLASDSEGVKDIARNLLKENRYEVKEFNTTAVHVGRIRILSKEFLASEERICDSYLGVYADLFMMARADYVVSSGSHFTVFAEMLRPDVGLIEFKSEDEKDVRKFCLPSRRFVGH